MTQALQYVEADIDLCSLVHGTPPCRATTAGIFTEAEIESSDFGDGASSLYGWAVQAFGSGGIPTFVAGASYATLTEGTSVDSSVFKAIAWNGAAANCVQLQVHRTANGSVTDCTVYAQVASGGYFSKTFSNPTTAAGRQVIIVDMSTATPGGGASGTWAENTFTELRVDMDASGSGVIRYYSIAIGNLDTSVQRKCYNTLGTCQDRARFTDAGVTVRFAVDTGYLPNTIDAIPCILTIDSSPATINPGVDMGKRASVRVMMADHEDSDTGLHGDPYLTSRTHDPYTTGTFFGKFRTRHPFLRGRDLRVITGEVGQAIDAMEIQHYVIDSFDGPLSDGTYTIIAKDPIKLADAERAQAPLPSTGFLSVGITDSDTEITLLPAGIGNDEYPTSGIIGLGGAEICTFTRDMYGGLNAFTVGYWKFDGSDGGTTFVDSSGNGRDMTAIGNAQRDTAIFKFGTAALLLDGNDAATVADGAHWNPANDFAIDCWIYTTSLGATQTIYSQCASVGTSEVRWTITTAGAMNFTLIIAGVTVANITTTTSPSDHAVAINEWQHVAIQRDGSVFSLWRNGMLVGRGTLAGYSDIAAAFRIGGGGTAGTTNGFVGSIDSFRFQSGEAPFPDDFQDALPGEYNTSSDIMTIVRAQYGTDAVSHEAEARVQLGLLYSGADPADIIYDLLVTYAACDAAWLPLVDWLNETQTNLARLYTALIVEPTSVAKLINELIEQAALAMWWDEFAALVRLQVLRAISTDVDIYDEDICIEKTVAVKDQPDKRRSQIWTYFAPINPLKSLDDADNYRSIAISADLDSEADYGSPSIHKIFSRWIPTGGRTTAERVNAYQIARYKNPPRRINFEVMRDGAVAPRLGEGALLRAWFVQNDLGEAKDLPFQITRVGPTIAKFMVEAEEFIYDLGAADQTGNLVITLEVDENNFNWRDRFDELYPTPVSGENVRCIINSGVVIGGDEDIAFTVGTWPTGVILTLENNGTIAGYGGRGGKGYESGSAENGQAGGTAIYTRTNMFLEGSGIIRSGGGGGGGGGGAAGLGGGGGGGGAGRVFGAKGAKGGGGTADGNPGHDGTLTTAGAGGTGGGGAGNGGTGGAPAAAGSDGTNGSGAGRGTGGAAGTAIDGDSYVVESGSLTVTGTRIN